MANRKALVDSWFGLAIAWIAVLCFTLIIGLVAQWLLFTEADSTLRGVAMRWPIMWILYFWLGIATVENITRIFKLQINLSGIV